jgi:hypothetical protein
MEQNDISLLREEAELLEMPIAAEVSPDPADDPFCACAQMGNAAFIVTLNPRDFPHKEAPGEGHRARRLISDHRAAAGTCQKLTPTVRSGGRQSGKSGLDVRLWRQTPEELVSVTAITELREPPICRSRVILDLHEQDSSR